MAPIMKEFRPVLCSATLLIAFTGSVYSQDATQEAARPQGERTPPAGRPSARPGLQQLRSISRKTTPADVRRILQQDDTNKDGKLGKGDRTRPNLQRNFDRFDTNSDGFLDSAEIAKTGLRPYGGDVFLEAFDQDGDGFLTKEEAIYRPLADRFESFDSNKDGKLAKQKMDSFRGGMLFSGRPGFFDALNRRMDANGDGKVSKEESINTPLLAKNFESLDANKDGFLTLKEIERLPNVVRSSATQLFQRMDLDKDGKLQKDEIAGIINNDFDQLDVDKSGFLTEAEFAKSPKIFSMMRGRRTPLQFVPADLDRDGKLSKAEAQHPMLLANFKKFDADEDGFLSETEHQELMDGTAEERALNAARAIVERHDTNDDGTLQADEFSTMTFLKYEFSEVDRDGNASLTVEEYGEFLFALSNPDDAAKKAFGRLDKDGNGEIAKDESPDMWERIASYDTNGNDVVTQAEFRLGEGKRRYRSDVRRSGQRLLGVSLRNADKGVAIYRVTPGSPAFDAKIEAGDVLIRIGGASISSLSDVRKLVNEGPSEQTLTLIRNGKETNVKVKLPAESFSE